MDRSENIENGSFEMFANSQCLERTATNHNALKKISQPD
jgi:hypothetical protein